MMLDVRELGDAVIIVELVDETLHDTVLPCSLVQSDAARLLFDVTVAVFAGVRVMLVGHAI